MGEFERLFVVGRVSPKHMRHLTINLLLLEMILCSPRGDSHYNHSDKNRNSAQKISWADSMAWDLRAISPTVDGLAIHTKLLEAQHELISSCRRMAIWSSKELVFVVAMTWNLQTKKICLARRTNKSDMCSGKWNHSDP
eukprot:scaffold30095_cov53-Attheya_sp.AAC.1